MAADANDNHAGDNVEDVVVTANRIEQQASRVGDSITVISAKEQRRSQKTAVSDLLAMTPGVTVTRNGGIGGTTSLRIRGAETDQTVVLIDGVKFNDPSQRQRRLQLRQSHRQRVFANRSAARSAIHAVGQPGDRRRRATS